MGDLVERRIFHIAAAPTTYQQKQIGFDGSVDAELGFTMVCAKDPSDNITKCLAKDKPARVQSFRILNGQFSWNFNEAGNVGTLSVANSVTSLGKLEFNDDLLTAGGIKARFADTGTEAADFLSGFGDVSLMAAINWLLDNSALTGLAAEQVLFGNRSSTGEVEQSSVLTFNSNNQLLIGTGPDKIGATANSLFVGGKLEVDGNADFDGWVNINAGIFVTDDLQICLGDSSDTRIEFDTTQTQNALVIGTDTTSRTLIIADRNAVSPTPHDFSLPAMANPTVAIMAADQDNDKSMRLSWDRIIGGDTVSIGASVGSVIALNDNSGGLSLNGDMSTSLIMGPGTVNSDRSLIAGISLDVGQGTGHVAALGESLLCLGTQLTIDAQHGSYIGAYLDVDGCDFSAALGQNIEMSHDYASARGKYVNTIWEGARHFGCDRYDTDNGSAMGIDGLVLVGSQTGGGTCVLHTTFGDATTYSFSIPDNRAMTIKWMLQTSSVGADDLNGGLYVKTGYEILWRNAGWTVASSTQGLGGPSPTVICDRGGAVGEDWDASVSIYHDAGDPAGTLRVEVIVAGTCTTDLEHIFIIESAVITQTSIIASS